MKSFENIYAEHNEAMVRVASKMVTDRDVVSDIVQEVFIYLFKKLDDGTNILHLRSWLYRVTFNKCIDHLRKQYRFVDMSAAIDIECDQDIIAKQEEKTAIKMAMNQLSSKEKILVVAYSEGMSYRELSHLTGIRYTSIGKTLSRTLKKLSIEMKKDEYGLY